MKVLIDYRGVPFYLAHGGTQTQIEKTMAGLSSAGLDVERFEWWNSAHHPDVIHYFSLPRLDFFSWARKKNIPSVVTCLFTEACNRPSWRIGIQSVVTRSLLATPCLGFVRNHLFWEVLRQADRVVVGLEAEAMLVRRVYGVPAGRISVVPLGLSDSFLNLPRGSRQEDHLITTGTITERKGSLELAQMARDHQIPILFVGKPYDSRDTYWKAFEALIDNRWVKYQGHVDGEAAMRDLLQASRGFVLNSQHENWCFSAHEAAACGLPLLVPDQRWSRERFGQEARYLQPGRPDLNGPILARFYHDAPSLEAPTIRHYSWTEVGNLLATVYKKAGASPH